MKKPRFLGITVFGYAAILSSIGLISIQWYLYTTHNSLVSKNLLLALFTTLIIATPLFFTKRTFITRTVIRVGFTWIFLSLLLATFTVLTTLFALPPETSWIPTLIIALYGFYAAKKPIIRKRKHRWTGRTSKRVVQLTDLHLGDIWGKETLRNIVQRVQELKPDVVAITGDLVDGMDQVEPNIFNPLTQLEMPVVFVTGNHDGYHNQEQVIHQLENAGVTILQDETETVQDIKIHGVAYKTPWKKSKKAIEEEQPDIILKHEPSIRLEHLTSQAVLAGHVHAGQLWPFHLLAYLDFPYVKGTYTHNNALLHISSGTKTWGPPFRLGTRSEIFVLDLLPTTTS